MFQTISRQELLSEQFQNFGLTGIFMSATTECTTCGGVGRHTARPESSRDAAAASCLKTIHSLGWRSSTKGVHCPACVRDHTHNKTATKREAPPRSQDA